MVVLRLGGFSEAARALAAATGRSHTRQGVYKLWRGRAVNGFPEKHDYEINGKVRELFDLTEVLSWNEHRRGWRVASPRTERTWTVPIHLRGDSREEETGEDTRDLPVQQ